MLEISSSKSFGERCDAPIHRTCSRCEVVVAAAEIGTQQWCPSCGTELEFQCGRCKKQFSTYMKLFWHQRSPLDIITYNCSHCHYTNENKTLLQKHMQKKKHLGCIYHGYIIRVFNRFCPTCEIAAEDANVSTEEFCDECGTNLDFQCGGCDQNFSTYRKLFRHQQSCSTVITYICDNCGYTTKNKSFLRRHMRVHAGVDESTATSDREKPANQVNRFCPSCRLIVANAKKVTKQSCTQCGTDLIYQCARCKKDFNSYSNMYGHIRSSCKFDCPLCGSSADTKDSLKIHLHTCVSKIHYRCFFCEYTDKSREVLRRHIATAHKDILKRDCCQDKADPYECEQCQIKVTICETCCTGFSSADGYQEHQKSCKLPLLKCMFCQFCIHGNENFKKHMIIAHLCVLQRHKIDRY